MIQALLFDWGDTIMRDYPDLPGPMAEWEHVEWIPFCEDALKEIHNKYLCCVASNSGFSDTLLMRKALERVGADKYFQRFFASKDIGYEKPDKLFFIRIAEAINTPVSQCIMIGNHYLKDIAGAKAAGMKTIFFNETRAQGDFPDADKIIFSMKELAGAIEEMREAKGNPKS